MDLLVVVAGSTHFPGMVYKWTLPSWFLVHLMCCVPQTDGAAPKALAELQPAAGSSDTASMADHTDYGAEYAATSVLIGSTRPFKWGEHVDMLAPHDAIALNATVRRHTFWFNEADISQQTQQRIFVQNISTALCAVPGQSEDEYMKILNGMLEPVRDAINRHVHSAFWVKSVCGAIMGKQYSAFELEKVYQDHFGITDCNIRQMHYGPNANVIGGRFALGLTCLGAVMSHEKYNLAEGFYFANLSNHLVAAGASFCRDPKLESTVSTMLSGLEARMDYHASNHAFDELFESVYEQMANHPENETWTASEREDYYKCVAQA